MIKIKIAKCLKYFSLSLEYIKHSLSEITDENLLFRRALLLFQVTNMTTLSWSKGDVSRCTNVSDGEN